MMNTKITISNQANIVSTHTSIVDSQKLLQMVNDARKECGERPIRNNDFVARIKDELEGETYEIFVGQKNGADIEIIEMRMKQALRVAARESKAVRRSLVDKLEEMQTTAPVDPMKLLRDPVTLRGLLMNYSEDNHRLAGENQQLSAAVESLEKHFTKGMTLPAFGKALNGVNTSKITWWAYQRGWIYNEQSDPEKEPRWRVKSYARDKYLTEQDVQIKDVGKEPFTKKKIVMLQKGTHRVYQLYLKGDLPMKTTWNGEFSHDKAIYTPETK